MAQKDETPVLIISLLMTLALLGGGAWWFFQRSGVNFSTLAPTPGSTNRPTTTNPTQSSSAGQISRFNQVTSVPSGLFSYGGSTSWAPIRLAIDSAMRAARPEFQLRYVEPLGSPPSSSTGIRMLLNDRLAFAQSSRPLTDEEYQQAQQRGMTLKQVVVAIDGLAIAVNPSLNLRGLTLEQLRSIYTGKVTNWQQLGGPNLSIVPFSRPLKSGGTVDLFREEVLGGQSFSPAVQFVPTTTQALRTLANNPGGIYYASAPEVVPQCTIKPLPVGRQANTLVSPYREPFVSLDQCPGQRNQINTQAFQQGQYPLTRNLFVVVKQNGGTEQQAGEAYANLLLTGQGQELISNTGFVRVR